MSDAHASIQRQIVSKIRDPFLLFPISFGLFLVSIGLYDLNTTSSLLVPLLIVFVIGEVGAVTLQLLTRRERDGTEPHSTRDTVDLGRWKVLPNRAATLQLLANVGMNTESIRVLAISGQTLFLPEAVCNTFATLRTTRIKCLLLHPDSEYVEARVQENPARGAVGLRHHILAGLGQLRVTKERNGLNNLEIACYEELPVFRLVIIDDTAYVSYYPRGSAGDDVCVFAFSRGDSWLYAAFEKHFERIWRCATPYEPPPGDA